MKHPTKRAVVARAPQDTPGRGAEPREGAGGATGALRTLTVRLALPAPLLTINWRRQHPYWRQQARESREQREAVAWAAKLALPGGTGPVPYFAGPVRVDLAICPRPKQQRPDDTGIWEAAKPWLDGLETAWIVDDDKLCRLGVLSWDKGNRIGELVITLTDAGE